VQLVLVRHGQSSNNALYAEAVAAERAANTAVRRAAADLRYLRGRVADPPLSALGVRQAQTLGAAFRSGGAPFTPTHLYASPTMRAVQTVSPLAEATSLRVVLHPDAYEVGGVHLFDPQTGTRQARPGATFQELRERCPVIETTPGLFPASDQPWSGGLETHDEQALPRAQRLLTALRAAHGHDDVVLLVSHQHFSQFVIAAVLGYAAPPGQRFRIDNTGHLSFRLDDGPGRIDWVNRVDHLDPADITN
jgi:2,3-bisphosphoglycerate-dependent phosphoglycerate mutase